MGVPPIIRFNGIFHCKPSILGYPIYGKPQLMLSLIWLPLPGAAGDPLPAGHTVPARNALLREQAGSSRGHPLNAPGRSYEKEKSKVGGGHCSNLVFHQELNC